MSNVHKFNISENIKKKFMEKVLTWSKGNLRDYPWRRNRDPYRVLISEVLLTRTKADQVVPVFLNFMDSYPNLEQFMDIKLSLVKSLIKTLGLNKRAETLKEISCQLKNNHNTKIPITLSELKSLNGIGDYCANAILCFGFGKKYPILDTNFIRLYRRVFNVKSKTKTAKSDKFLWQFAEYLLPERDFIEFNYSLLDIGGLFCLPIKPKCENCPLKLICMLYSNNK
jgi:A/G-specific adenine glycosylase